MAALFFDRLRNAKFNALTTDIANQTLQGKDSMPRTYDKFLKLAGSWKNKPTSTHNKNNDAGMAVIQPGSPGRGDQGGKFRRRGQGGRHKRGGGPSHGNGGGRRLSQNHQLKLNVQEITTAMTSNL